LVVVEVAVIYCQADQAAQAVAPVNMHFLTQLVTVEQPFKDKVTRVEIVIAQADHQEAVVQVAQEAMYTVPL
jgi:hypothetical protein